jgi:hypothetical protein
MGKLSRKAAKTPRIDRVFLASLRLLREIFSPQLKPEPAADAARFADITRYIFPALASA